MAYDPAFDIQSKLVEIRSSLAHLGMLTGEEHKIIEDYRSEWEDLELTLSYQLMNWATRKINTTKNGVANYVPYLLTSKGLETSGIHKGILHEQVDNAQLLDETLHAFPRLQNRSMMVYRGETCNSFYYQKAEHMGIGDEMVILPFLSTSVNPRVGRRFTGNARNNNACVWQIEIPKGQIFPYVSASPPDFIPHNFGNGTNVPGPEYEVLLPTHARLKLINKIVDGHSNKIHQFKLIGFAEKSEDFWEKTLTNLLSVDGVPEDAAAATALAAAADAREDAADARDAAAALAAADGPALAAEAGPAFAAAAEPAPLRRSTRERGKKQKTSGGATKASKTRKRTKRNRKSRRKVRK